MDEDEARHASRSDYARVKFKPRVALWSIKEDEAEVTFDPN